MKPQRSAETIWVMLPMAALLQRRKGPGVEE